MRYLKFLSLAICATLLESTFVCAQETKDYYKFDDKGVLVEFLQTTPDGVKISYAYSNDNKTGLITYPDGTQVDYSKSLTSSYDGPRIWPNTKKYNINGALPIKDWYKDLRKATSAPTGAAMLDDMFGIGEVVIVFPDNSQVSVEYKDSGVFIQEYVDVSENGDRLSINRCYAEVKIINLCNSKLIDSETGELSKTAKLAAGGKTTKYIFVERQDNYQYAPCDGKVILEDGSTFTGNFNVLLQGEKYDYQPKSSYIKTLFGDDIKNGETTGHYYPWYGIDNVAGIYLGNGSVVNKENKIVAMYKDSKQLDEFDMASELAAEQGRIDREKAAAKKAASEKAAITSKYGQKYANAFFAGKVVVGMPWSLVEIGLDAHSFKNFYTALLSLERQTAGGIVRIYSLIGDDLRTVGSMRVNNGAVQSITYY